MCERRRQGRSAHPLGIGGSNGRAPSRGPAGIQETRRAAPVTGVDRFVGDDGGLRQPGTTTYAALDRLRGELTTRFNPVERARAEAQKRILRYLHIPSDQFSEAQEIVSMTRAALGGNVLAAVSLMVRMFMAGVDAMQAGQRVRDSVCAAHTFGYWVFSAHGLSAPDQPPGALHQFDQLEDSRGNYDRLSAEQLAARWERCHRETISRLDRNVHANIPEIRNRLQQDNQGLRLIGRDGTPQRVLYYYKTMQLAPEFTGDPRAAASLFFLKTLRKLSTVERRVATVLYRRYPYDPAL